MWLSCESMKTGIQEIVLWKVSTNFINLREQFMKVHELFMNIIMCNGYKQVSWVGSWVTNSWSKYSVVITIQLMKQFMN